VSQPGLRVFAALGTDYHPFGRAVSWLDAWQQAHPDSEVFVQHGSSPAPTAAGGAAFLDHDSLQQRLRTSDVVVCHGGPATISEARAAGHVPVVLPRDPERGEHVDDHQLRFSAWARDRGLVRRVTTSEELTSFLDRALAGDVVLGADGAQDPAVTRRESVERFGRLLAGPRSSGPKVAFIAGFGRSGSTLLERILGESPSVACLGEIVHLWQRGLVDDELCACGEPFSRCPLWQEIGKEAFGGWARVDAHRVLALHDQVDRQRHLARTALPWTSRSLRKPLREYAGYYAAVYRAAATVTGATTVVDSSKHASLAFALTHDPEIDLRVLHIVRDPRAVAYSWSRHVTRPEAHDGQEMARYSAASSSAWWLSNNAIVEALRLRRVPLTRVRYEALVSDPVATVTRAVTDLDLGFEPTVTMPEAGTVRLGGSHSVAGNPMRFTTGDIPLHLDEAWRTAMAPVDRRTVSALTFPLQAWYSRSEERRG
jgi:UDP-N-acetylglucosamine transferase subunit ALG13